MAQSLIDKALGKLEKLQITAFSKDDYADSNLVGEPFTALVNPESYNLDYKIAYNVQQGSGTTGTTLPYVHTLPEEMNFEFLFDSTGLLGNASALSKATGTLDSALGTGGAITSIVKAINGDDGVAEVVRDFKKMLIGIDGRTHEPKFFKLVWGKLIFKGRCTGLSINYKLFNPDGTPIRAVCKVSFKGAVDEELRIKEDNKQSPDLTHYRIVRKGDTLPAMCFNIYGKSEYYIEIARVNKLSNFRSIRPGDELFFPPIAKTKRS